MVGIGRTRKTTTSDNRYIVLQANRDLNHTSGSIALHLLTATGRQVSRFTGARRLHKGNLFSRRPERYVPLTATHRWHCLQWYQRTQRVDISSMESYSVFTDENRPFLATILSSS
ncbi:transposable element Tcb2 transposase [Trichonephila clavipes]|nr:transposable element Tcb2 transposase [Trichonephila clavipes]